jgi:hypothetical protein
MESLDVEAGDKMRLLPPDAERSEEAPSSSKRGRSYKFLSGARNFFKSSPSKRDSTPPTPTPPSEAPRAPEPEIKSSSKAAVTPILALPKDPALPMPKQAAAADSAAPPDPNSVDEIRAGGFGDGDFPGMKKLAVMDASSKKARMEEAKRAAELKMLADSFSSKKASEELRARARRMLQLRRMFAVLVQLLGALAIWEVLQGNRHSTVVTARLDLNAPSYDLATRACDVRFTSVAADAPATITVDVASSKILDAVQLGARSGRVISNAGGSDSIACRQEPVRCFPCTVTIRQPVGTVLPPLLVRVEDAAAVTLSSGANTTQGVEQDMVALPASKADGVVLSSLTVQGEHANVHLVGIRGLRMLTTKTLMGDVDVQFAALPAGAMLPTMPAAFQFEAGSPCASSDDATCSEIVVGTSSGDVLIEKASARAASTEFVNAVCAGAARLSGNVSKGPDGWHSALLCTDDNADQCTSGSIGLHVRARAAAAHVLIGAEAARRHFPLGDAWANGPALDAVSKGELATLREWSVSDSEDFAGYVFLEVRAPP